MSPDPGLQRLRWDGPWLTHLTPYAGRVSQALGQGQSVAQLLDRLAGEPVAAGGGAMPVRFVPQEHLPEGQPYEEFIHQHRLVPTRDNLHDLFNGLTWLTFPLTKARLNHLQAEAMAAGSVGATRGPLRDALTIFDENAAILLAPADLQQALIARQWRRLFVELRPLWAHAQVLLFGHAAQEKLQKPRKAITAHVYLPRQTLPAQDLDAALAADLEAGHLTQKPYSPLPVLGIPGWWPGNENFSFYDDPGVFRAPSRNT